MIDTIMNVLEVAAVSMGVIPLGVLIIFGGGKDLRDGKTFSGLAMVGMGLLLVGLSLHVLTGGAIR